MTYKYKIYYYNDIKGGGNTFPQYPDNYDEVRSSEWWAPSGAFRRPAKNCARRSNADVVKLHPTFLNLPDWASHSSK